MKLVDLTHLITENMPAFPGTEPPHLATATTIEKEGFKETLLTMYSHTGTHMDAPAHLYRAAPSLDHMDISRFTGSAFTLDCTKYKNRPGAMITMDDLESKFSVIEKVDFLLFNTGWSNYWFEERYFENFPAIDLEVAKLLVDQGKKGIGIDTISIDPLAATDLPAHQVILSGGMVVIENLTNLDQVMGEVFTLCAFPLKYQNADGSPIRAVAMLSNA